MASRRFDPKVFQRDFVALGTADVERAAAHYRTALGMREVEREADGSVYLSIGYGHHDLILRPAERRTLLHVGFQLKPQVAIADLAREVRGLGLAATLGSDDQPGVPELPEVEAPGGVAVQLYPAIDAPAPGFARSGAAPFRLGHVAILAPEGDRLIAFFEAVLGFCRTDDIAGIANFLTGNRDHHVVNIVKAAVSRLHHIAFELRDNARHPIAADTLRAVGVPLLWGPSRDTAGHDLASYHHDPDRLMVELYTEMDVFVPELGLCEPRPWHEHRPLRPRSRQPNERKAWGPAFAFDLAAG